MKETVIIFSIFLISWTKAFAAVPDTICYQPDKQAYYKYGEEIWYRNMHGWTDEMGLRKLKFEVQHVKMYLVIDTFGTVTNVINAGCTLDTAVERILTSAFLKLIDYIPAEKNKQLVTSVRLYEFNVNPYLGARYDVRVKLQETQATAGKDFTAFISMYNKWIKKEAYFPKNYKQDRYDGVVVIEFSFNKRGKPTKFSVVTSNKEEFVQNSLVSLFCVKAIPVDYIEMIGPDKKFKATFDYVSFANEDMYGIPANH